MSLATCDNAPFCSDSSLKAHIMLKHPEKCQHCQKCRGRLAKKVFSNQALLSHYLEKHKFCFECQEQFLDKSDAIDHMCVKHGKNLKCYICPMKTTTEEALQEHINTRHRLRSVSMHHVSNEAILRYWRLGSNWAA